LEEAVRGQVRSFIERLLEEELDTRARAARLRHPASVEDVDYRAQRGLDRASFLKLAACDWIRTRRNLLITDPCEVGKSWLSCALGRICPSCTIGRRACSQPWRSLAATGAMASSCANSPAPTCSCSTIGDRSRSFPSRRATSWRSVEDRYDAGSLLIASQLPVDRWYDIIAIPTLADAVLDRVVHNAYRIELSGESLRKRQVPEAS
jgi:DNA replication protein DnaC